MNWQLVQWLLADVPAGPLPSSLLGDKPPRWDVLIWGGGVVTGLILIAVVGWLSRTRKQVSSGSPLDEHLGNYPPAPAAGPRRLLVQGSTGRLRLVVIAPVGKRPLDADQVENLLDGLVPGLGEIVKQDRPRIRIWPPQLSQQGFAPTFGQHTHRPEGPAQASPWILAAGPAKSQGQQILLGLAIQTEKASKQALIIPGPLQWAEVLQTR